MWFIFVIIIIACLPSDLIITHAKCYKLERISLLFIFNMTYMPLFHLILKQCMPNAKGLENTE